MEVKAGDRFRLKLDSQHYTGRYAGTEVVVKKVDTTNYCTVTAADGYSFMCPKTYFDYGDDDFFDYEPPPSKKCTCGAHETYGKDCPPFFHYDYCDFYQPKPDSLL